ncbi:helix-turn-helix domain-containing protein [Psychroflexus sp. MES1-P1E]|uniref:helix-turn-helix domain-containing protein n=1 Tax=Psychroflexus sp. MES1-P1E TaxID=2058320 RepID=UPI000C7A2A29|nr:AraC family transcriptional regulator [Psychroflexus sp. MES1-P1E]PKG42770.1 AraC family transcriptional regulator [Psychroflexus sp. MES1-P1E]
MIIERKQYELFEKTVFEKLTINAPFKISNPMPEEACFLYMLQGQINYKTENHNVSIPQNNAVLLKCGNYFSQLKNDKSVAQHQIIIIHFNSKILKSIYTSDLPKIFQVPGLIDDKIDLSVLNNEFLIQKYIENLLFYFDNPTLVNEDILVLKFKEIILLLCQTKNASTIQHIFSQLFSPSSFTFKEAIESNIYSNFGLAEFANLTNLSLSSFKREFKKNYNDTPANYIRNRKLEKASELLLLSEERITDIAFDCGFNNLANFSHLFAEKNNCSPSTYRLNQKNK